MPVICKSTLPFVPLPENLSSRRRFFPHGSRSKWKKVCTRVNQAWNFFLSLSSRYRRIHTFFLLSLPPFWLSFMPLSFFFFFSYSITPCCFSVVLLFLASRGKCKHQSRFKIYEFFQFFLFCSFSTWFFFPLYGCCCMASTTTTTTKKQLLVKCCEWSMWLYIYVSAVTMLMMTIKRQETGWRH